MAKYFRKLLSECLIFDIGETLVNYEGVSLNWGQHYENAILSAVNNSSSIDSISDKELKYFIDILTFYNTRSNPRIFEIAEGEALSKIAKYLDIDLYVFEDKFFSYFQRRAILEDTAVKTLKELKRRNVNIALLTDCAYGMPRRIIKHDVSDISQYFDKLMTSCEIGVRKPSPKGIEILRNIFSKKNKETLFVGNEPKDIECAKSANIQSILLDKTGANNFGQNHTVNKLCDILQYVF